MANKLLSKDGKLIGQDKTILQAPVGGGASWGEIGGNIENQTDLIDLVNSKAILHEIIYDGTNIKDTEGNVLGFADIKMLLDNPHDYVYVNDLTNHCILNYGAYEDDAIWFNSRYKIDGTNYLVRLIINWNDQLQYNVDEVPNINKVLTKPNQAPTQNELVGIGTDNAQKRYKIGEGLELDGDTLKVIGMVKQTEISATDFMTLNAEYEMIHFSAVKTGKLLTIDMVVKCLDESMKRFGYVNESYRPSHTHNVHCCVGPNETDLFYGRHAVFIYSNNGALHNSDTSMRTGEYAHITTSYII